jgi:hypothetical protein
MLSEVYALQRESRGVTTRPSRSTYRKIAKRDHYRSITQCYAGQQDW